MQMLNRFIAFLLVLPAGAFAATRIPVPFEQLLEEAERIGFIDMQDTLARGACQDGEEGVLYEVVLEEHLVGDDERFYLCTQDRLYERSLVFAVQDPTLTQLVQQPAYRPIIPPRRVRVDHDGQTVVDLANPAFVGWPEDLEFRLPREFEDEELPPYFSVVWTSLRSSILAQMSGAEHSRK